MTGAELDPGTTAIIGVLGLNALTAIISTIWGGNGQKGVVERVAVLENDMKHVRQDTRDIKGALGILHRDLDK